MTKLTALSDIPRNISAEYCLACGEKLMEVKSGYYYGDTGEPIREKICPNLTCRRGCDQEGHKWKWWDSSTCKRCGYKNTSLQDDTRVILVKDE